MKAKAFAILNIAVMIFYLLKPALPYIEYTLNRKYIERNLCIQKDNPENSCHGECFLNARIEEQGKSQDAGTNDDKNVLPEIRIDDHLKGNQHVPGIYGNESRILFYYFISDPVSIASEIFVPPRD